MCFCDTNYFTPHTMPPFGCRGILSIWRPSNVVLFVGKIENYFTKKVVLNCINYYYC